MQLSSRNHARRPGGVMVTAPPTKTAFYVNVYKPADAKPGAALPVMVFLHGGGNVSGSSTIYDGVRMAEVAHAVVVIPANRLGVFGSLALPSSGANGGTFILQDNLAALRWVKRNVAAFGGNPADVTVSGESSGGTNVCVLLASPAAAGLFHQAIVQSGLCNAGPFEVTSLSKRGGYPDRKRPRTLHGLDQRIAVQANLREPPSDRRARNQNRLSDELSKRHFLPRYSRGTQADRLVPPSMFGQEELGYVRAPFAFLQAIQK